MEYPCAFSFEHLGRHFVVEDYTSYHEKIRVEFENSNKSLRVNTVLAMLLEKDNVIRAEIGLLPFEQPVVLGRILEYEVHPDGGYIIYENLYQPIVENKSEFIVPICKCQFNRSEFIVPICKYRFSDERFVDAILYRYAGYPHNSFSPFSFTVSTNLSANDICNVAEFAFNKMCDLCHFEVSYGKNSIPKFIYHITQGINCLHVLCFNFNACDGLVDIDIGDFIENRKLISCKCIPLYMHSEIESDIGSLNSAIGISIADDSMIDMIDPGFITPEYSINYTKESNDYSFRIPMLNPKFCTMLINDENIEYINNGGIQQHQVTMTKHQNAIKKKYIEKLGLISDIIWYKNENKNFIRIFVSRPIKLDSIYKSLYCLSLPWYKKILSPIIFKLHKRKQVKYKFNEMREGDKCASIDIVI